MGGWGHEWGDIIYRMIPCHIACQSSRICQCLALLCLSCLCKLPLAACYLYMHRKVSTVFGKKVLTDHFLRASTTASALSSCLQFKQILCWDLWEPLHKGSLAACVEDTLRCNSCCRPTNGVKAQVRCPSVQVGLAIYLYYRIWQVNRLFVNINLL